MKSSARSVLRVASYLACEWKLWAALDGLLERLFAIDGVSQVLIGDSQEHKPEYGIQVALVLHPTRQQHADQNRARILRVVVV